MKQEKKGKTSPIKAGKETKKSERLFFTILVLNHKTARGVVGQWWQFYLTHLLTIVTLAFAIFLKPSASTVVEWIILVVVEIGIIALNAFFYYKTYKNQKILATYLSLIPVFIVLIINCILIAVSGFSFGTGILGATLRGGVIGGMLGLIISSMFMPKRLIQSQRFLKNSKEDDINAKSTLLAISRSTQITIMVVSLVALLIIGVSMATYSLAQNQVDQKILNSINQRNSLSNEEYIKKEVRAVKILLNLPKKLDEVTTIVDVTAENNALRYHYLLSITDTSDYTSEKLKEIVKEDICKSTEIKEIFDRNISLEYEYKTNTGEQFFFKYSNEDCK